MPEIFENPRQVHHYLESIGVRVGMRTVYNHAKDGRLAKGSDGCFSLSAVQKYAMALQPSAVGQFDQAALSDKQDADTRKAYAQAKHWEIKTKILDGKYVERELFERSLAARAMVIRSDGENFFRSHAPSIIAKVDGKPEFSPDLIDYLLDEFEKWLSRYSEPVEFKINETIIE